jgi:hypothetical protein
LVDREAEGEEMSDADVMKEYTTDPDEADRIRGLQTKS